MSEVIEGAPENCFRRILDPLSRGTIIFGILPEWKIPSEVLEIIANYQEEHNGYTQEYLEIGENNAEYFPHEFIIRINSDNIGDLDEGILRKEFREIDPKQYPCNINHIISCITEGNITTINWMIIDFIMTKLKHFPEKLKEVKHIIRECITDENEGEISRFILDAAEYKGGWGEFVRTFEPDGQKRWLKIASILVSIKKSIGF